MDFSNPARDAGNLEAAFQRIDERWSPRIVARVNDTEVKLARIEGTFDWHRHPGTDELFLVHSGEIRLEFRDREDVRLEAGDFHVVPRGVEHRPVAPSEAEIVLIEAAGTRNTGDVETGRTREAEWL